MKCVKLIAVFSEDHIRNTYMQSVELTTSLGKCKVSVEAGICKVTMAADD
jgi:hypothetical protein